MDFEIKFQSPFFIYKTVIVKQTVINFFDCRRHNRKRLPFRGWGLTLSTPPPHPALPHFVYKGFEFDDKMGFVLPIFSR
jgi:hypothetical protein